MATHYSLISTNLKKKKKNLNPEKHISSKLKPSKPTSSKPKSGGLEHLIGLELRGVTELKRFDFGDEAGSSTAQSSEEVATVGEDGEVVAEITAALASFFVEEVLRGNGELVDDENWDQDFDPLVQSQNWVQVLFASGFRRRRACQWGAWPPGLVLLEVGLLGSTCLRQVFLSLRFFCLG